MEDISQRLNDNPDDQLSFWSMVAHKLSWRGPVSTLQNRFKAVNKLQGISIREEIVLKRLYERKRKGDPNVTWDSILYHFPGRDLQTIINKIEKTENINYDECKI